MQLTFLDRLKGLFSSEPPPLKRLQFDESENEFLVGATSLSTTIFDRATWSRDEVLEQCLDAWRFNPLARRIVEITSQYVVGGGFKVSSEDPAADKFLKDFWTHRFNRMDTRLIEMCDELTRSGNLFLLLSTDGGGMSFIREIPASLITEIKCKETDLEQEQFYVLKDCEPPSMGNGVGDPPIYPAYDPDDTSSPQSHCVIHFSINKPAGAVWGEPDLAPILKWLSRYTAFLDDRIRLNRYRNAFLYVVKSQYSNETTRRNRQLALTANPPTPGSILVTDESETWDVISPKLESDDAERDGLALKKMIASGAGLPLHFLAEPESATRTTAEASGGPTFRKFQQRQQYFTWLITDLLHVVLDRFHLATGQKLSDQFEVHPSDLSGRDNVALAMAGSNITSAFETLYDLGAVSKEEMVRVLYRFIGEEGDPKQIVAEGSGVDLRSHSAPARPNLKKPVQIDPETGEITSGSVSS